ncbi:2'-5' RNA ligase [Alteromonas sp. RW2A1]|uniref:RNA 2',3'-cyclic phosphodiesterase n=1 Tax=Alteromonas sp. RW2A1 TaxID=1917158 RepID=UPI000903C60D|nr:RNA 2',3'-cyclic phosphodiesterase [Alteromonas sp. RW2A1]APE04684.1 2'-5' RNA ligase [Alteromonas sp. RW2A1]
MRCFIGLDLSATQKLALESWQQKAMPEVMPRQKVKSKESTFTGKKRDKKAKGNFVANEPAAPYAVPAANYHMTLCFLGSISHRQHESLLAELDALSEEPFAFTLDNVGVWNGPKILFASPTSPPKPLMTLAKQVRKCARRSAIEIDSKEYKPHVTMVRKATSAMPLPLFSPNIDVQVDAFHLFESVSTPQGVTYPIRHSWSLEYSMSVREKLRRGITE